MGLERNHQLWENLWPKPQQLKATPLSRALGLRGLQGLFPVLWSLRAMQVETTVMGSGWDSWQSVVAQSSAHGTSAETPGQELG